jgi:dienelactone hydrolase
MESKEVYWKIGKTVVDGTLTMPDGPGKHPAVAFVAGSGPTDRNWESPLLPGTNGSAQLLADELTRAGYVTLRYDKRASGPKVRQNMEELAGNISLESHFDELKGAVEYLRGLAVVDQRKIFALTSSEGAIHAMYYQEHHGVSHFAGIILTGAPGRPLNEVTNYQIKTQTDALPNGDDLFERYNALVKKFEGGTPFTPDPVLPEAINQLVAALSSPVNQPFTREFWSFKPAEYFSRLNISILVIIGKKDLQVDWKLDGEVLEKAAKGKKNITFFYPENANHVLKYEPKPRTELTAGYAIPRYNAPGEVPDKETVKKIIGWLDAHSKG